MIRKATQHDLPLIANMNRQGFSGNKPEGMAEKWVSSHFAQGDQYHYFVFEQDAKAVGYISWEVRGGFARGVPVIELDQLGVDENYRGQGIGTMLMSETFEMMKAWIKQQQPGAKEMRVMVWCLKGNDKALAIYEKLCNDGIKGERSIYSTDEVMLRGTYSLE